MKKLLLSAAIAVFGFTVNAQDNNTTGGFAKGDVVLSGGFSFGSESTGDVKSNGFEFNPTAGYFVSENVAVGISAGIFTGKEEDGFSDELKTNAFTAGAFAQYYFTPQNQFSFLGQFTAAFTSSKVEQGSAELKGDGFSFGIAPGINYFVSNNFALQASVGVLSYTTFEFDGASDATNNFDFGLDFRNVTFSLVYKL